MIEQYTKLVRDKIPEDLDNKGISYEKRTAEDYEYVQALFKKLKEEVNEFQKDKNNEELGDVIEVVETIKKLPEFIEVGEFLEIKKKIKFNEIENLEKKLRPINYLKSLFIKLNQRTIEFYKTKKTEELAELIEVLEAIKEIPEFRDVEEIRQKKLEEKGGFEQKIILSGEKYKK